MKNNQLLMIFFEPTPYILSFIEHLRSQCRSSIDILFLKENFSQTWALALKPEDYQMLPNHPLQSCKVLYQQLSNNSYDAIFLTGWSTLPSLFIFLYALIHRIPLMVDSDTPLLPRTSLWKRAIKRMMYPMLFRIPRLFLPSGTRQARYLEHYGVPSHKIILEKMTVDVVSMQEYFQQLPVDATRNIRLSYGLEEDDFICLFVGRLIERKGILELLHVFRELQHPKMKLVIAGDGPLKSHIESVAMQSHTIQYLGRLEKEALLNAYFMSNIVVLPAHWEPWGLVVNEAFAAGKPVVASDEVGCVDDLVHHGKTGLIVKPKCLHTLREAILHLYHHPFEVQTMKEACLSLISQWTLQDEVNQFERAMSLILKTT